ncbi:MAG: MFS transporter [Rhodospirillaceae bacterium]|nr:MFS transporter [Rhodospirillaceae bacterium]
MSIITRRNTQFAFLNVAHSFDHMFMLIYTTVVLSLESDPMFSGSYGTLLTLSVWSFVAFGLGSLPAGWLGDKWSKPGMMAVFLLGIGASAIATGFAQGPVGLALGLCSIGVFASIYHPVGIAMVAEWGGKRAGRALGINGVFGNLGVSSAAIVAGVLIDLQGWRAAFIVPGALCMLTGVAYVFFVRSEPAQGGEKRSASSHVRVSARDVRMILGCMFVATICTGIIFISTTVSMPKVLAERLGDLAPNATALGGWVFVVFMSASIAQVTVGYLLDRYHMKTIYLVVAALLSPALLAATVASGFGMIGAAMLVMFLVFGLNPINDMVVARYAAAEWRARIYAFKFLASLGVASAAVPLVGILHDTTGGFYWVFMGMAGLAIIVGLAGLAMPVKREHLSAAE